LKTIIIGELIVLAIIIFLSWRSGNVKRTKTPTSKGQPQNKIPLDIPSSGYDSTGRKIPTNLEALAARDSVDIQKIENQKDSQAELERVRKKRIKKTHRRPYH
jgi:hypothetical protein